MPYSNVTNDERSFHEVCAKTLEYAYDDFCAAQPALAVGDQASAETFARHDLNYTK